MLTIQPKIQNSYNLAFGRLQKKEVPSDFEDDVFDNEDAYEKAKSELEEQKEDFENLSNSKDFNTPKPVKTFLKGGAILTTGLLGGMATGWGTKKSIQAFAKLGKTNTMQSIKKQLINTQEFLSKATKAVKEEFLKSDAYKKPVEKINKWEKGKVMGPVIKFFKAIGKGISTGYNKVKDGVKFVYKKLSSIKKETYEKATVNTVGVSGGIASGVTALKEQDEKGKE